MKKETLEDLEEIFIRNLPFMIYSAIMMGVVFFIIDPSVGTEDLLSDRQFWVGLLLGIWSTMAMVRYNKKTRDVLTK